MKRVYLLGWLDTPVGANAITLESAEQDHKLIEKLEGEENFPFDFHLKQVCEGEEGLIIDDNLGELDQPWLDYLPNNLAWPLMSKKLKNIVEVSLTGNEGVDWLVCNIIGGDEQKAYYVLRFNKKPDVLDVEKTLFVKGTDVLIKPCFAQEKICEYSIFTTPTVDPLWKITPSLYVSEFLKKLMQREKVTGLNFEKACVV